MRRLVVAAAALALAGAGCGGGDGSGGDGARDPVAQVPSGIQEKVRAARAPKPGEFPAPDGRSLQAIAESIGGGPEMGLASSVFVAGRTNRVAFGVIDDRSGFVYGPSALYVARSPTAPARGPYPAPADVLVTQPAYRSQQAATEADPFAAVYAAQVPFTKPGRYAVLAVTRLPGGRTVASPARVRVTAPDGDRVPGVGEPAPRVATDTVASAGGDVEAIDTRRPTSDMHRDSFAAVVGRRPVALLFATPQLCQSRVCGPVVDVALQLKARYGDRMDFIHQEVYAGNDPAKGLRPPLQAFRLPTEPWLFVVGRDGRITARLEGSFGLDAFERALKTAL